MNIYKRRDGRYEGRISRGRRKNGTRKFDYFFGRTRAEVQEKMADFRKNSADYDECSLTVAELFNEWHTSIKHKVKESTSANYYLKAHKHILPVFGEKSADSIESADIYSFIESKQKDGLSNRYISDMLIVMKSMFRYAVRTYHIFNPMDCIELPRTKSPEIQLLDEREQARLQRYIAENQNRATLGVAISMATGMRIGELCALQWQDIDLKKRVIAVSKTIQRVRIHKSRQKTKLIITEPKSRTSRRKIPITADLVKFLLEYQGNPEEYVISGKIKPVEPRTMQYRFAKILKKAGLPHVHFHALRHIFASDCIKLGFDVKALSELLGHSKTEITLDRYVHSDFSQKMEYMDRLSFDF